MGKSAEEMYNELLTMESVSSFLGNGDDDDGEEFLTSKEKVKLQKEVEERFGIKPASRADIDEEFQFKSYAKKRVHKYTETEMKQIRESCERTIVHDYGDNDIFHMSDEERAEKDMLADLSMKLGGLKRTYRRVDQYIEAMRIVMQAWDLLERRANFLHSRDDFFTMVGEGRIVSGRIIMPKLKKMDTYNMDTLIKYISNPELDPTELVPEDQAGSSDQLDFIEDRDDYQRYYQEYIETNNLDEDDYDVMNDADQYAKDKIEEEEMMRLLSEEEAQFLTENIDNPPEISVKPVPRKYIKGYDRRSIFTKKKRKKLNKADRMIQEDTHDMLTKIQNNPANIADAEYNRSYVLTNNMFDTSKPPKDFWDDLHFDGSWANEADVFIYNLVTMEELMKQHPPKSKYLTYADHQLNQFFQAAERNGINMLEIRRLMEMPANGSVSSKMEVDEMVKENKKLEGAIIQRITKLNNDPKFKKLVDKAEKALNKYYDNQ